MTNASETYEDEYEEYDEFDDEDDERGLSGFAVLIMGLVMIGAFFSVVWIAYQQGIKTGENGLRAQTPYVAADPEPIKIETADDGAPVADREVYDAIDGSDDDPVTILAEGPEEPVDRGGADDDPIADLADAAEAAAADAGDAADASDAAGASDELEDRLASLAREDEAALASDEAGSNDPDPAPALQPTPVSAAQDGALPTVPPPNVGALTGTHVVQVGAFRSDDEAQAHWSRMQAKFGDYLNGKSNDVERADLGERGVYYRLRIGPFRSADAARSYCAGLKERGQDCLVKPV